jgi:hydroxymethylglutaryl-CoA reductase
VTEKKTSRFSGFYKLSLKERLDQLATAYALDDSTLGALQGAQGLDPSLADHMVENVIGIYSLPLGVATNFLINGKELVVPMAIEEPSVIAGASYMAKLIGESGGFNSSASPALMIAQLQVLDVPDLNIAKQNLLSNKSEILEAASTADPILVDLGGGPQDIEVRLFPESPVGPMLVVHLILDTLDAMGANAANSTAERITPLVEELTTGRVHLRILSNLADRRLATSSCTIPPDILAFNGFSGEKVRDGIVEAWAFASVDPYRAATHNKGIMNGVDAVLIATGNDWRAVEAGAHAYASRTGIYTSLSQWQVAENGDLEGRLELPLAVGTIGGSTRVHPTAKASLKLMGVTNAQELAEIIVSVGLAQNLAALRALATEGIQKGHMRLHARQVAIAAGAQQDQIDGIAEQLVMDKNINIEHAKKLVRGKENE